MSKLRILKATIADFGWCPQSDPDKPSCAVLAIKATLTQRLATALGKPWVFEENGVARHIDGTIAFTKTFEGGSVELGDRIFQLSRAWKFRVKQAVDDEDITLQLQARLQFTEGHIELFAWAIQQGSATFGIVIDAAQMDLGLDEEEQQTVADETSGPSLAPAATVRGNGRRPRMVVKGPEGEVLMQGEAAEGHPAAEVQ